jgi:hypothetical protein
VRGQTRVLTTATEPKCWFSRVPPRVISIRGVCGMQRLWSKLAVSLA